MDEAARVLTPPAGASQRERDQFYQGLKRNARAAEGRCRYCGRYPEPGRKSCLRCLETARAATAARRERIRAQREAERRALLPRRCPACAGGNLGKAGQLNGRRRYVCRDCGRHSYGDGPPPPRPHYPCPYCGAQCKKRGRELRTKRQPLIFSCTACGRYNTMLWPEDTPSPGGPFPHRKRFLLNYPAYQALMTYCQEKKRSVAQAIREIFIRAGATPPLHASSSRRIHGVRPAPSELTRLCAPALPPPLPSIPPGGVRFPSAMPEALTKLTKMRSGRSRFVPSILVAYTAQVMLNDAALAGLLETMRRRGLNHQDAARALITESAAPKPIISVGFRNDLDDRW